jgi:hypothetical protein
LAGSVLLTLFGFGITTKESGKFIGYKGYFYGLNQISGLYIILFSIVSFNAIDNWKPWISTSNLLLGGVIAILLGTKAVILSYLFILLFLPVSAYIYNPNTLRISSLKRIMLISLFSFVFLSFLFIGPLYFLIEPLISELLYSYSRHPSILSFMTSGRILRIDQFWELMYIDGDILNQLFGYGFVQYTYLNSLAIGHGTLEMDIFDIIGKYGLLGALIIYTFWIYIFLKILLEYLTNRNKWSIPMIVALLLLIFHAIVAGHIISSATVGVYLGCATSFITETKLSRMSIE